MIRTKWGKKISHYSMVHCVYIKCGFILPIVVFGVDPMFFNSSGDFVVYFSCLLVDE